MILHGVAMPIDGLKYDGVAANAYHMLDDVTIPQHAAGGDIGFLCRLPVITDASRKVR
jgi:hypothetical protein